MSVFEKLLSEFGKEYNAWQDFMEEEYGIKKVELENDMLFALAIGEATAMYRQLNEKNRETKRDFKANIDIGILPESSWKTEKTCQE